MAKKSSFSQQQSELAANRAELERIYSVTTGLTEAQLERGVLLEKENEALQKNIDALDVISKNIKEQNKFLDKTETLQASIADKVGKSHKLYKESQKYIERQRAGLSDIANFTQTIGDAELASKAQAAADAYRQYQKTIASIADRTSFTGKRQEEANVLIARARAEYDQSVASLTEMGESGQFILDKLNQMADETDKFGASVTATTKEWKAMDAVLGSFSGIPAMNEINTLLKTSIRDTLAWKAAVFAVGAALGKAAFDYFGAPIKAGMQADKERAQNQIDLTRDVAKIQSDSQFIPTQISQERAKNEIEGAETVRKLNIDAQFAAQKAAISFSASMQTGAAQFQRAAKTALFGKGIGSVGYGAAQMQLAGISADKVAAGMQAASSATGKMPTAKSAADMAIMAERTGQSVDNIASISEMFQRIDGASESTAMNLTEGLRAMADQVGIGLGELAREIAESTKEMLSYNIKSGPALAKQVAYAQTLGVKFADIAKAGQNMVLNYKDSIKAEMSLSSMLGRNVDLSEVRAKFMAGDTKGAQEALKAQGLDPSKMNVFEQQQFSAAAGGLDISSLSKITTGTGKEVNELGAGDAKAGNQAFLSKTQSAEATLNSQQASISAKTAIIDAELSKKIGDAYLKSPEYAAYLKSISELEKKERQLAADKEEAFKKSPEYKQSLADTAQLDIRANIESAATGALSAVAGGIGASLLDKGFGKLKGMFGKKRGGDTPSAPSSPSSPITSAASAGADALVPGAGGLVESLSSQVDSVQAPVEKALSMGEKLKDLGKGIASFGQGAGKGIAAFLQGIAKGISAFATPQAAIGLALVTAGFIGIGYALKLAAPAFVAITPILIKIAEVVGTVLVEALRQAGPVITSIFNGIGTVIGSIGKSIATVITSIATSIAMFATMDAGNLGLVAASVTALSVAVALFGGANILAAVGKFFGGGTFDDLKDISNYASPIQMTADAVWSLANAFSSLSSIDTSKLNNIPWGDMGEFASEGGKFVLASSGGGSFALSKQTTTNIDKMAKKTEESFNELKFNSDIQNRMVGVLVANLAALQQIATNTAGDTKQINLDGKSVNKKLLANLQSSFGIART